MTDTGRNDIGSAVVRAVRDIFAQIHGELTRPSVLYRPSLTHDGHQWRAVYGDEAKDDYVPHFAVDRRFRTFAFGGCMHDSTPVEEGRM